MWLCPVSTLGRARRSSELGNRTTGDLIRKETEKEARVSQQLLKDRCNNNTNNANSNQKQSYENAYTLKLIHIVCKLRKWKSSSWNFQIRCPQISGILWFIVCPLSSCMYREKVTRIHWKHLCCYTEEKGVNTIFIEIRLTSESARSINVICRKCWGSLIYIDCP